LATVTGKHRQPCFHGRAVNVGMRGVEWRPGPLPVRDVMGLSEWPMWCRIGAENSPPLHNQHSTYRLHHNKYDKKLEKSPTNKTDEN